MLNILQKAKKHYLISTTVRDNKQLVLPCSIKRTVRNRTSSPEQWSSLRRRPGPPSPLREPLCCLHAVTASFLYQLFRTCSAGVFWTRGGSRLHEWNVVYFLLRIHLDHWVCILGFLVFRGWHQTPSCRRLLHAASDGFSPAGRAVRVALAPENKQDFYRHGRWKYTRFTVSFFLVFKRGFSVEKTLKWFCYLERSPHRLILWLNSFGRWYFL